MKLYDMRVAPNPRRVRIFLAEKGIEIPTVEINIRAGENLAPAFLAVNPRGVLPTLQLEDGTVIDESTAICRYFEELRPDPPLLGRGALDKAMVECWTRRVEADAGQPVVDAFRNSYPPYADRAVPGRKGIRAIPELVERGRQRLADFYPLMDQRLGATEFVAGAGFSFADITLLCIVDFARAIKLPTPDGLAHFERWHAQVSARPSAAA
ncbi:MAG TPA: glutathione S-transferase N-terminal domain-containing protein [Gammaproteobacteria bacterium]|nr:glutathione S-transferase N-terminal domain-containing protein [Gammaproteobacteria bacterium]HRP86430.1 glutathione S-transferase N-terminal domain-containing protein [Gammaproteobacteria bacterium]